MALILIVEDKAETRENIIKILSQNGYTCVSATNGAEGLQLAIAKKPDLIICDIRMPVLDGFSLKKELNNIKEHIGTPFIFLTVKKDHEDVRYGMNLGASDYIIKPFKTEDLLNSVETRLVQKEQNAKEIDAKVIKVLENFTALAKHECNTSLNALIIFSEAIREASKNNSVMNDLAVHINQSANRLNKYLNNMIELMRLVYYKPEQNLFGTQIDLSQLAENIIYKQAQQFNRTNDTAITCKPVNCQYTWKEDMTILFTEVCYYAFNYSSPGTGVSLMLEENNGFIMANVEGTLIHSIDYTIAEVDLFTNQDSIKSWKYLNALGLYLSKLICKKYGGEFSIISNPSNQIKMMLSLNASGGEMDKNVPLLN
jgi:two-component system sensor histidine kinase/response regulator